MKRWTTLFDEGRFGLPRRAADRDVVFSRGDPAHHVHVLRRGAVEIQQPADDGRAVLVKVLVGPCLFGVIEQLGGVPHYLETVQALGAADIATVDAAAFAALLRGDAALSYECLVDVGTAFCVAARQESARLQPLETQVASVLLAWADATGEPTATGIRLGIKRSQEDIAAAVGCSERSVTRILADWKAHHVVDKSGGRFTVVDIARLRTQAGVLHDSLVHRLSA
ncbi:MAG TPA: Crp/Fnr family transcriptional regulator [Myxococcota bacterium]